MKIYRESIPARSTGLYPTFHKITDKVQEIIDRSALSEDKQRLPVSREDR